MQLCKKRRFFSTLRTKMTVLGRLQVPLNPPSQTCHKRSLAGLHGMAGESVHLLLLWQYELTEFDRLRTVRGLQAGIIVFFKRMPA
jgi:hypothetical protein